MPAERQKKTSKACKSATVGGPCVVGAVPGVKTLEREENIRKALHDIIFEKISIAEASRRYQLPTSTLQDRQKGAQPRHKVHETNQKLTPMEEAALTEYCQQKGWRGEPLTIQEIRHAANQISGATVGENWVYNFRKRNPSISPRTTQKAESKRSQGLNPEAVSSFYEELQRVIKEYDIYPCDIWNADEKGVFMGGGEIKFRTLVASEMKQAFSTGDENRKMVTVLECIRSNGESIPPLLIHEGAAPDGEWIRLNPINASLASSPNGWTSNEIGWSWFVSTWEPLTRKVKRGRYRVLILDGHVSHCTLGLIVFAIKHDVIIICLPPHTTHKLQPCDVGVFSHLSCAWRDQARIAYKNGETITKNNFLLWYARARKTAITEERVKGAFEQCGIWPVNPAVIKKTDLAPAKSTTTHAAQPLPATLPTILEPILDQPQPAASQLHQYINTTPASISHSNGHYQIKGLPQPLGPKASRAAWYEANLRLHALLDQCISQMSWDHGQKVLMERENAEIRQKAFGKKSGRSKVSHLQCRARVLTSEESIALLYEADHKKNMAEALKEARPILKEFQKRLEDGEKELLKRDDALEKAGIKEAEGNYKAQKKELSDLTRAMESAMAARTKADRMRRDGKSKQTRTQNEEVFHTKTARIEELNLEILNHTTLTADTEIIWRGLVNVRELRLAAIEEDEKRFQNAVVEEKEAMDIIAVQLAAKRASRPKVPKDPRAHWASKVAAMPEISRENKENQLSVRIHRPLVPSGVIPNPSQVRPTEIREVVVLSSPERRVPVDPLIVNMDLGVSDSL